MKTNLISVVLPSFNIEKFARRWDENLKWINKKIIIDLRSIDNSRTIFKGLNADVYVLNKQENFDKGRLYGMRLAKTKWVLKLDVDEVISSRLRDEILSVIENVDDLIGGIYLKNRLFFCGKMIKYGYALGGKEMRIFKRDRWFYFPFKFHQPIINFGRVLTLKNYYLHFNYLSCAAFLKKNNFYTSYDSIVDFNLGRRVKFIYIFPRTVFTFIKQFFKKKGFMDGLYGLILATLFAISNFIFLLKIYERQKKQANEVGNS